MPIEGFKKSEGVSFQDLVNKLLDKSESPNDEKLMRKCNLTVEKIFPSGRSQHSEATIKGTIITEDGQMHTIEIKILPTNDYTPDRKMPILSGTLDGQELTPKQAGDFSAKYSYIAERQTKGVDNSWNNK
jgi:hypothetical protein